MSDWKTACEAHKQVATGLQRDSDWINVAGLAAFLVLNSGLRLRGLSNVTKSVIKTI